MKAFFSKAISGLKSLWQWYASQYKGKWYQRIVTPIASLFVFFFLYLGAVDTNFLGLFGVSPSTEIIQNPITNEASYIYSADSVMLGKFFNENRSPVKFDEISPYVIDALISTEDERFYLHHGIDYQGLFAAFKDIAKGNPRGASTITQQLVKNLFKIRSQYSTGLLGKVPGLGILVMKSKEWITAIKIEGMYSKQDILTLYLNTVDFGSNSYGIKTAAKTYFKTTPQNLTAEQSAVLVGLLKATTTYNPKVNPDRSLERRNVVLNNMYTHGKLTKAECDSLCQLPLDVSRFNVENSYDGQALYFREAVKDYLSDWCKENNIDLYSDGLKIYTTLDTRMQRYAERAVQKHMRKNQNNFNNEWPKNREFWCDERHQVIPNFIEGIAKRTSYYAYLKDRFGEDTDSIDFYLNKPHRVKLFDYNDPKHVVYQEMSTMDSIRYMVRYMHCGFVAMEPQTRYVRAWVGDIDFGTWKYDKVTAMRQPGSTFKLFVYASAFENNDSIDPNYRIADSYVSIPVPDPEHPGKTKNWTPHNANGGCSGARMPLRTAFAQSINTVAVKLGQETGIPNVVKIANKMGITTKLDPTPSLALGSSDVSLLDLVNSYSTVMDDGMTRRPILVTKVVDRDGKVIYDCDKDEAPKERAVKYKTAYYMQRLLWGGMREPGGTSQAMWQYAHAALTTGGTEIGGKTGTSNNHSDSWYVGCTQGLVGGAWVGGEYRCIHYRSGQTGQGSRAALPIFGYFIEDVLRDPHFAHYGGKFPEPKEDIPTINYRYTYEPVDTLDEYDGAGDEVFEMPDEEETSVETQESEE